MDILTYHGIRALGHGRIADGSQTIFLNFSAPVTAGMGIVAYLLASERRKSAASSVEWNDEKVTLTDDYAPTSGSRSS
jgi:hypothetical protein